MRVDLSGQVLTIPRQCSCCGGTATEVFIASATKTKGKRVVTSTTREWRFPHCQACQSHLTAYRSGTAPAILLLIVGGVLAFLVYWVFLIVAVIGAIVFIVLGHARGEAARTQECTTAGVPVRFIGWHGTVQSFEVTSRDYAAALLAANARKAINLTEESREALSGAIAGQIKARLIESPSVIETREAIAARWVVKLEGQRGAASRRAVLAEALSVVSDAKMREQLMLEASRIEVEAVLAKVDGLKTATAKRRHLQAALEELKADKVSDELQAKQIKWLEDALIEVEQTAK